MLMGRRFKIFIDSVEVETISDGELKEIKIPTDKKELILKIMNYKSAPIMLDTVNDDTFEIKQNLVSNIATYGMMIFTAAFFITKYVAKEEKIFLLYIAVPFLLVNVFYATFGRKNVIQLIPTEILT